MTEGAAKVRVGLFMIGSHFFVILLAITLAITGAFSTDELTTVLGFVGPLFAGYSSLIISFIIKHKNEASYGDESVNPAYAFLSFAVPAVFVFAVVVLLLLKAFNYGIADFQSLKVLIGSIEAAFGVYVGQFIYSMFEGKKQSSARGDH